MTPEVLAFRKLKSKDPLSPEVQDQPGNIDPVSEDNVNNNKKIKIKMNLVVLEKISAFSVIWGGVLSLLFVCLY